MREVVFVSGMRTPVGDFRGSLNDVSMVELGVIALKAAMEKVKLDPTLVEEVVVGCPDMAGPRQTLEGRSQSRPVAGGIR